MYGLEMSKEVLIADHMSNYLHEIKSFGNLGKIIL